MRYVLTLVIGAVVGAALVYFLLVGPARAEKPPGELVRAPDAAGSPPGTAVLTLDEQFFATLFDTIFRDLSAPTFKLASVGGAEPFALADATTGVRFIRAQDGGCQNQVVVAPEGSGVRTGVRLQDGQMLAPLAFSGSYNAFGNCLNFRGSAQSDIALSFNQADQTVYGQINVQGVNLENISPLIGGIVTQFVQNSINQRVNPLVIMRGQQLTLAVPVQASNGTLRAQPKDVRAEIKDGALRLYVTYDFSGARSQ
jgi:hypothetical protein